MHRVLCIRKLSTTAELRLLSKHVRLGQFAQALSLYESFNGNYDIPRIGELATNAYCVTGDVTNAKNVLEKMETLKLNDSEEFDRAVANVIACSTSLDEAFAVHRNFQDAGKESYEALVRKCSENDAVEDAFGLLKNMVNKGIKPSIVTYSFVMDAILRVGSMNDVDKLQDLMDPVNNFNLADSTFLNPLIKMHIKFGDIEGASKIVDECVFCDITIYESTEIEYFNACLSDPSYWDYAEKFYEDMVKEDTVHSDEIFHLAVKLFCEKINLPKTLAVLKRMHKKSVEILPEDLKLVQDSFQGTFVSNQIEQFLKKIKQSSH
jgi:pentatricopeptide repeat protein